jgi:hypothetical protein
LGLFRQCGIFRVEFGTVPTVWYFSNRFWDCSDNVVFSLSEQSQNLLAIYHTVGTVPKSTRKIPHCRNSPKIYSKNTTLSEQSKNLLAIYQTVETVPKSTRTIPHCRNSPKIYFLLDFVAMLTVCYFSIGFRSYTDNVVFFY